ncbi:MAG TPA: D-alanyl-D-alanine carboxypeptidase/D-alanyl-D-alanine-endopeptidase [Rhizomicrobium sp.]|jgi:D-alanyl-D-alanine carboxypeptidase/D-alanyl-D-alanine-endopeptidase (penicillin-binding protein 4)|nr:D-alanyl-D-alanine carboxypeptidase/D-alanyl-D-alanine-endopeptidase [Rhizomicrobium sp.]
MNRQFLLSAIMAMSLGAGFPAVAQSETPAKSFTEAVAQVTGRPVYAHGEFGLEVYSLDTGKVVYAMNGQRLFTPGSTAKLFTEGTALYLLGADYRFHTPLYRTGKVDAKGTLHGDLILVGSGDPNLSDRLQPDGTLAWVDEDHTYGGVDSRLVGKDPVIVLHQFAKAVADAGIKQVKGRVLIDVSLFPEGAKDLGTGEYISPVVVNDNAIDIIYAPGAAIGDPAKLTTVTPQVPYVHIVNQITTADGNKDHVESKVVVDAKANTETLTLSGSIGQASGPVVFAYAVRKPSQFAGVLLTQALKDAGVKVSGKPDAITDAAATRKFYRDDMRVTEHVSAPLSEDVKLTLKVSQNLHASTMPYVMGAVLGHASDKIDQKGFQLEHDYLQQAGLDMRGASQSDGAGGAGVAFYTPDFAVHYLAYMARQPHFDLFQKDLPILGRDGTLADTQKNSPGAGHVFAKTGTYGGRDYLNGRRLITGKGLAGYTTTPDGRHLAFAFYVNNVERTDDEDVSDMCGQALGEMASALYALPLGDGAPQTPAAGGQ